MESTVQGSGFQPGGLCLPGYQLEVWLPSYALGVWEGESRGVAETSKWPEDSLHNGELSIGWEMG